MEKQVIEIINTVILVVEHFVEQFSAKNRITGDTAGQHLVTFH